MTSWTVGLASSRGGAHRVMTRAELEAHIRLHAETNGPWPCPVDGCERMSITESFFRRHMENIHPGAVEKAVAPVTPKAPADGEAAGEGGEMAKARTVAKGEFACRVEGCQAPPFTTAVGRSAHERGVHNWKPDAGGSTPSRAKGPQAARASRRKRSGAKRGAQPRGGGRQRRTATTRRPKQPRSSAAAPNGYVIVEISAPVPIVLLPKLQEIFPDLTLSASIGGES